MEKTDTPNNGLMARLKEIRSHLGKSQNEMDPFLGLGKGSWQRYESVGQKPGSQVLEALVSKGFNANWILTKEGGMLLHGDGVKDQSPDCSSDFVYIPKMVPVEVSTGGGSAPTQEVALQNHAFRRDWLVSKGLQARTLAIVTGKGDSMEPTIPDGSTLLVDTAIKEFHQDGVYVVRLDGHLYAKRLQRGQAGSILVISDNPLYNRVEISRDEQEDFQVLGKVVWLGRSM